MYLDFLAELYNGSLHASSDLNQLGRSDASAVNNWDTWTARLDRNATTTVRSWATRYSCWYPSIFLLDSTIEAED